MRSTVHGEVDPLEFGEQERPSSCSRLLVDVIELRVRVGRGEACSEHPLVARKEGRGGGRRKWLFRLGTLRARPFESSSTCFAGHSDV